MELYSVSYIYTSDDNYIVVGDIKQNNFYLYIFIRDFYKLVIKIMYWRVVVVAQPKIGDIREIKCFFLSQQ